MAATGLVFGDEAIIPWGVDEVRGTVREVYGTPPRVDEVRGTVREVYGTPPRVHVVVELTPELSGSIVDEPTTVALPIDAVKKVAATA